MSYRTLLVLALSALVLLAYTYFVYPLLLALLARLFPWRPRTDPAWQPNVTACVPAYNADATIDAKLASLVGLDYPGHKLEILVYSDGSTDRTDELVQAWAARDGRIRFIRGENRLGKPTALNRMRAQAQGDVLLLTDARQPLTRGALRALLAPLADARVGCVTGNLRLIGPAGSGMYWRYENWIRRQESRFRSVVGMTGPLAVVRRTEMPDVPAQVVLDDVWIPMQLRLRGARVVLAEDAVALDQAFPDTREFARKARTLAGNFQVFTLMPRLLSPLDNPSCFETWSHKISRLACPWALVLLFLVCATAATGWGPPEVPLMPFRVAFAAQVVFLVSAIFGARSGRLGTLARTFVVLNAAAVVGLWRFLAGRQKVTW